MEVLEILYIFALRVYQFSNNVIAMGHLRTRLRDIIFRVWQGLEQEAPFFGKIEHIVDNRSHLVFRTCALVSIYCSIKCTGKKGAP